MKIKYLLIVVLLSFSGCQGLFQQLGATEYGIVFRKLPTFLFGGLEETVKQPGEMVLILPWEKLIRYDTSIKNIEWGPRGEGSDKGRSDYVQTRAFDGNEVSLSVTIQYHVSTEPEKLLFVAQNVGEEDKIRNIIVAAARADIRTYMNRLKTAQFFINEDRYRGEAEIRDALRSRFKDLGIEIVSVNLGKHRFERILPDGKVDRRYQKMIDDVKARQEETDRERLRKATVIADKKRERSEMQAHFNRNVEESVGLKQQAIFRADAYYESKSNDAMAILSKGQAEVEGIKEQILALSGPGGKALLKLEVVKHLLKNHPQFVVLGQQSGENGMSVNRIDTNELLKQIGVIEALKEKKEVPPQPVKTK